MIGTATVTELKGWLDRGEVVLIDVREPGEWKDGHIAGAVHVPLGAFAQAALPPLDGRRLVIQCRSGGRSMTACQIAAQKWPDVDAYNLEGGILAWQGAGYAVQN